MFVQIHMLQSMPPGNLNRDDAGYPKKCLFGGVTRGRISSQCLKQNIRHSLQFKDEYGDALADRTQYLPTMMAKELKKGGLDLPDEEMDQLMRALTKKFKSDGSASAAGEAGKTPQLVFFPPPFALRIAELIADLRKRNERAYRSLIGETLKPKPKKDEEDSLKAESSRFIQEASNASKSLTIDIALFGRMTTSDLVVNVEAACQVAHAISTHETMIESDWFTAMDDKKMEFASTQTEQAGAAFIASGETVTFFNSAVYYKYLNLDTDAMRKHLPSLSDKEAANAVGVLVSAAALANPTGKQNSFAAHGVPELILVEMSKLRRPVSYANAFLQPVEGGVGRNLTTESVKALHWYVDSVAAAFAPPDVQRVLLAVGHAASPRLASRHEATKTLEELVESVVKLVEDKAGAAA